MNHDSVFSGANEGFDVQEPFDLPEKDFDLPSAFVEFTNCISGLALMVGNKFNLLLVLLIPYGHCAKLVRILFAGLGSG